MTAMITNETLGIVASAYILEPYLKINCDYSDRFILDLVHVARGTQYRSYFAKYLLCIGI